METLDQMPDQFTISSTKPVSRRPKRYLGRSAKSAPNTSRPYPETPTPHTAIAASATIPIARTTTQPDPPAVSSLELSRTPADRESGTTQQRQASKKPLQKRTLRRYRKIRLLRVEVLQTNSSSSAYVCFRSVVFLRELCGEVKGGPWGGASTLSLFGVGAVQA